MSPNRLKIRVVEFVCLWIVLYPTIPYWKKQKSIYRHICKDSLYYWNIALNTAYTVENELHVLWIQKC